MWRFRGGCGAFLHHKCGEITSTYASDAICCGRENRAYKLQLGIENWR